MTEGVTDLMYIASGTKDAQLDISPAKPLNGQKIWTQCYKGVMYCNSTIAAIERSPLNDIKESSEADKLPLLAEGVVIRSFYYWLLTCIFGDVALLHQGGRRPTGDAGDRPHGPHVGEGDPATT